jgi:hypothetical protein
MPAPPLRGLARGFEQDVARQSALVRATAQYRVASPRKLRPLLADEVGAIAELAYLRVYLAWERFLEQAFLRYMCGAKDRRLTVKCYIKAPSIEQAVALVIPEGRSYIEWGEANRLRERADRYFRNGEPFRTALTPALVLLDEMRFVRNQIAHSSDQAQRNFHAIVRRSLGHVPPGISAGGFLLLLAAGTPLTYFDTYVQTLRTVRSQIIS